MMFDGTDNVVLALKEQQIATMPNQRIRNVPGVTDLTPLNAFELQYQQQFPQLHLWRSPKFHQMEMVMARVS